MKDNKASARVHSPKTISSLIGLTSTMTMIDCREVFAEFFVDLAVAMKNVPKDYEVRIHPNGKAMLLLMVQDCDTCVLNGIIRISPMRMSHIWIELNGPEEIGPALPGTTGSLPTRYYYALPHQIENALAQLALRMAGIDVQKVKRITLGGYPSGMRQGRVVEQEDPTTRYSWNDSSALWQMPNVVTGRRRFYRQYGRSLKRRSEGLVVCSSSFLGVGEIRLQVDIGSAVGRLGFGTTLKGLTNPVQVNACSVRIRVSGR